MELDIQNKAVDTEVVHYSATVLAEREADLTDYMCCVPAPRASHIWKGTQELQGLLLKQQLSLMWR